MKEKSSPFKKRAAAVFGGLLCIVLGFLLLCNLIILVKGTLNPEKPPSVFGVTPMIVLSGSMSGDAPDHIEVGDLIFVGQAQPEELEAGDVISFMSGGVTVTHRITAIHTQPDGSLQFETKGDANNAPDTEPVAADQLVGIYLARIPKAGDVVLFLQQPLGMLLCIGLPLLAFILYDILRRQQYARRQKEQNRQLEAELARLRRLAGQQQVDSHRAEDPQT